MALIAKPYMMKRSILLKCLWLTMMCFSALGSLLCMFMFYINYLRWHSLFNELGRYFDLVNGVVYEASSIVWSIPTVLLLLATWYFYHQFKQTKPHI